MTEKSTQTDIIIAEKDHDFSRLVLETLKDYGLHSMRLFTGKDVIDRVAENPDSLLLLGCSLQDMTGSQVIEILSGKNISVPFIPIIGPGDEKAAVELMEMGAKNYIIKGTGLTDIIPLVVKNVLRGFEWEKEAAEAEDILQKKSYLNQIILDRMPCVTLLLESYTIRVRLSLQTRPQ
ncbi:MAG: response regulator [Nitrospiraceae bacterium]|nr:MAG: response regulator [Nitrospiraceae bacterium]